jgi:hypothetical protein
MRRALFISLLVSRLAACVPIAPEPESRSSASVAELKSTMAQCDELLARFKKATPEQQQACEVTAGDCQMLVNEKRNRFIQEQGRDDCRQPDADTEARCNVDKLLTYGDVTLATEYFKANLWCLEQLAQCIATREEQAESDSTAALATSRRNDIERSDTAVAELARVSLAEEKIKYIRATLPPDAETECSEAKPQSSCLEAAHEKESTYTKEFDKTEQEYQRPRAAKLYEEMTAAEATCYKPELDCLLSRLSKYGETAETRLVLENNFKVLEQRQRLVVKLGPESAQACLDKSTNAHQADIIQSYLAYVREPVLFFRRQLHRAFLTLHQAQVDCLKRSR